MAIRAQQQRTSGDIRRAQDQEMARIEAERDEQRLLQEEPNPAVAAALADEQSAAALDLPSDVSNLPVSTEDTPVETTSGRLEREIQEQQNLNPLKAELLGQAQAEARAGATTIPPTESDVESQIEQQVAMSQRRVMPDIDYSYQGGQELAKQLPLATASASSYDKMVSVGNRLNAAAEITFANVLASPEPQSIEIRNAMLNAGLITPDGKMTPKQGNILSFQWLQNTEEELNKKDKMIAQEKNPQESYKYDDNTDDIDIFDEIASGEPISKPHVGDLLNPEYERLNISRGVIDKSLPTPDVVDGIRTSFGGASTQVPASVLQGLDALYWQVFDEAGFVEKVTHGDKTMYQMSQEAVDYYFDARDVMNDVIPETNSLPSLFAAIDGLTFGAERDLGFKKEGNVSIKSMRAVGDDQERQFMDNQGRSPIRINNDMFSIGQRFVNSIIRYQVLANGRIILNRKQPLTDKDPKHFYSTNPYAERVGMHKAKWDAYKSAAEMRLGMTEIDAEEQANMIMAMQARKLAMDTHYGSEFSDKIFYLRKMYASITGRIHDRNSRLSPQQSKYVRNFLESAVPVFIDLGKTNNKTIREQAEYAIGRALLSSKDTGGRRIEDIGWNETTKLAKEKIFNDPENYSRIVNIGRKVRDLKNNPSLNINEQLEGIDTDLANATNDPEEWGILLQAYIDMANYDDANSVLKYQMTPDSTVTVQTRPAARTIVSSPINAEGKRVSPRAKQLMQQLEDARINEDQDMVQQLESELNNEMNTLSVVSAPVKTASSIWRPRVLIKHDTKQSGMAIQAALFGNVDILKRVGAIFSDEKNIIPEGDIRDLFMENLDSSIKIAFTDDLAKQGFWTDIINNLAMQGNSKAVAKALSRAPLMESSYGKFIGFMQETAIKFINGEFGDFIQERIKYSSNVLPGYNENQAIIDLNRLIAVNLNRTLSFQQQKLLKDLGAVWAILGNQNARVRSATGKMIYLGGKEAISTGQQISLPTPRGQIQRDVTAIVPTSTGKTEKVPLTFDEETFKFKPGQETKYGQQVINQLPVVIIQALDAAIMVNTINLANKGRKEKGLPPLFMLDIHDSIISDINSVRASHQLYNKVAKELTMPGKRQYPIWKMISEELSLGVKEWKQSINPKDTYEVSDRSLTYRGLHGQLQELNNKISDETKNTFPEGLEGLGGLSGRESTKALRAKLTEIKRLGWKPEGAVMTGEALQKTVQLITNYFQLASRLRAAQAEVIADNEKAAKLISPNYMGFN